MRAARQLLQINQRCADRIFTMARHCEAHLV